MMPTGLSSDQQRRWKAGGEPTPQQTDTVCLRADARKSSLSALWHPSKNVGFLRADLEVRWLGSLLSFLLLRVGPLCCPEMTCFCNILSPSMNKKRRERNVASDKHIGEALMASAVSVPVFNSFYLAA